MGGRGRKYGEGSTLLEARERRRPLLYSTGDQPLRLTMFSFSHSGRYPSVEPPPLDKRKPKPLPKKLSVKIKPVEVCDMTKYVYLG